MRIPPLLAGLLLAAASMTGGCDCDRYDPDEPIPNLGGTEDVCDCGDEDHGTRCPGLCD